MWGKPISVLLIEWPNRFFFSLVWHPFSFNGFSAHNFLCIHKNRFSFSFSAHKNWHSIRTEKVSKKIQLIDFISNLFALEFAFHKWAINFCEKPLLNENKKKKKKKNEMIEMFYLEIQFYIWSHRSIGVFFFIIVPSIIHTDGSIRLTHEMREFVGMMRFGCLNDVLRLVCIRQNFILQLSAHHRTNGFM